MQSLSSRLPRSALDAAPDAMIIIDGADTIFELMELLSSSILHLIVH